MPESVVNNDIEARKKLSPFDMASIINEKKSFTESDVADYNSFMMNRIYSNTQDTVFFANEMNMAWQLPKELQFAFYYYGLPKKRRFGKWNKNQDDADSLELIQECFGYSRHKAKEVLPLLRPHLDSIRKELEKGGKSR